MKKPECPLFDFAAPLVALIWEPELSTISDDVLERFTGEISMKESNEPV